jgi:phospholipase A1
MPKLLSQIARMRFAFAMFCPLLCITFLVSADQTQVQQPSLSRCLQNAALVANDDATVGALRAKCERYKSNQVLERFEVEKLLEHNAFVITPHRQNYMLFATYNDKPNQSPFVAQNSFPEQTKPIQHQEAKFQTSFKVPLTRESLMFEGDGLYFAFTVKFFWQVYNKKISAPFRETNYRPEVFYQTPLDLTFLGGEFFSQVGFEHESNGRSQLLSRSWNRVFAGIGYQRDNWTMYLQPWYRLPESDKLDDGDPATPLPAKGDDNPNITDYMGHYEFFAIYKNSDYELSNKVRFNFKTGKGALETGFSFPLVNRLRGYVQFYNGYGESLIDHDHLVQRVGIGVLLSDFL